MDLTRVKLGGDLDSRVIGIEDRVDNVSMLPAKSTHTILGGEIHCSLFKCDLISKNADSSRHLESGMSTRLNNDIDNICCDRI